MAAMVMVASCAAFVGCHKEEAAAPKQEEAPATVTPAPAVVEPKAAETPVAPAPVPAPATGPSAIELQQRVAAFKAFHPYSSGLQLVNLPPFASQLDHVLDAIGKDPALLARIRKAPKNADQATAGPVTLNLKVTNYSMSFSDRLLATVLSGQTEKLVDLVLGDGAGTGAEFILVPDPSPAK